MMEEPPVKRWPLVLALVATGSILVYLLHPILAPFALGGFFAYLGDPLVDRLEARGYRRTTGVVLVFVMMTLILALMLVVGVPLLINQLDDAVRNLPGLYRWLAREALPWVYGQLNLMPVKLPVIDWEAELAAHWQSLGTLTADLVARLTRSGLGIIAALVNLALVPVVAFYLMRDWDRMMDGVLDLIPRAWQENVSLMVGEADDVLGAFMRGQLLVMVAQAVIYSAGLWLVGLEFAVVLGTVAGLAAIIPYAGALIGVGSSLVAAWVQFSGDLTPLLWVLLVFGIGQTLESMVLTPALVGDRIGLHPVMVIFALMAGGQLAGFTGVLLALPIAAVAFVFFRHALQFYRRSQTYQSD